MVIPSVIVPAVSKIRMAEVRVPLPVCSIKIPSGTVSAALALPRRNRVSGTEVLVVLSALLMLARLMVVAPAAELAVKLRSKTFTAASVVWVELITRFS
nr:hypothetical protein [uncultured archaeon]